MLDIMHDLNGLWDFITKIGAVLIPLALYYIKTEIGKATDKIDKTLAVHMSKFDDHVNSDNNHQMEVARTLDKIKDKLNII